MAEVIYLKDERRIVKVENVPLLIFNSSNIFGVGTEAYIDLRVIVKDSGDLEIEQTNGKVLIVPNNTVKEIFVEHYFRSPKPYLISNKEKVLTISF